jgi:hypothetical protein
MPRGKWMRESDAEQGDGPQFAATRLLSGQSSWRLCVTVRCPICGSPVEIGGMANRMDDDSMFDECIECGVKVRALVQWREART